MFIMIILLPSFHSQYLKAFESPYKALELSDVYQGDNQASSLETPGQQQALLASDWWSDGPPTSSEGDGGYVGEEPAPIQDPVYAIPFLLLLYVFYKTTRTFNRNKSTKQKQHE